MSDTSRTAIPERKAVGRPVSLITVIFIGVLLAAAFIVARSLYKPTLVLPQNAAAENLPPELAWKATAETRRDAMKQLRESQLRKESNYAWIDQQGGVIQLPIGRAMELTVEKYGRKPQR